MIRTPTGVTRCPRTRFWDLQWSGGWRGSRDPREGTPRRRRDDPERVGGLESEEERVVTLEHTLRVRDFGYRVR